MNALILVGFALLAVLGAIGVKSIKRLIIMKASELSAQLDALKLQVAKARTEVLGKITDLETSLADVELPVEATAALEALKAEVQKTDDIVPDAPAGEQDPSGTEG